MYLVGIRKSNSGGRQWLRHFRRKTIRAQTKVSATGSERRDLLIFRGHSIVKKESTGLGKIFGGGREEWLQNDRRVVLTNTRMLEL